MRELRLPDILFFVCFSHVFAWIFNLLFIVELNKHNCTGMTLVNALNIGYTSVCIIAFLIWAIKEWRRERHENMIREPYTRPLEDQEDFFHADDEENKHI